MEPLVASGWEVAGIRDGERFFRALGELLPGSAYLVFDGCSIAPDVRRLLEPVAVPPRRLVPLGTAFPRSQVFHVPSSAAFLEALANVAAAHAESEICDHFHAYDDRRHVLQWYDAFDLPLLIDGSISERAVQGFCRSLGARYAGWRAEPG
jgi:hypothetical protein